MIALFEPSSLVKTRFTRCMCAIALAIWCRIDLSSHRWICVTGGIARLISQRAVLLVVPFRVVMPQREKFYLTPQKFKFKPSVNLHPHPQNRQDTPLLAYV